MMHSRLSKLIVLFALLICLPLQGLAAISMPACQAHSSAIELKMEIEMEMHMDSADTMSHCEQQTADHTSKKSSCNQCLSCYLSVAQAIIPFSLAVELSGANPMFATLMLEAVNSIPSSHFHPPRTTLA